MLCILFLFWCPKPVQSNLNYAPFYSQSSRWPMRTEEELTFWACRPSNDIKQLLSKPMRNFVRQSTQNRVYDELVRKDAIQRMLNMSLTQMQNLIHPRCICLINGPFSLRNDKAIGCWETPVHVWSPPSSSNVTQADPDTEMDKLTKKHEFQCKCGHFDSSSKKEANLWRLDRLV